MRRKLFFVLIALALQGPLVVGLTSELRDWRTRRERVLLAYEAQPKGNKPEHLVREDSLYKSPIQLALSKDGRWLYVVCERADALYVIDAQKRKVRKVVKVGKHPFGVCVSPDGRWIYVSNRWTDDISVIDARTLEEVRAIPVGFDPHGLITDKEGRYLYVANLASNDVSVVCLKRGKEVKKLRTGYQPFEVALSPDGRYVYVSNQLSNPVPFREPPIPEVTIIDTKTNFVVDRRDLYSTTILQGVECSPDGEFAVVALELPKNLLPETQIYQGWMVTYGLAFLEARPRGKVAFLLTDEMNQYYADPFELVFSPDGKRLYVSCSGKDVITVLDMDRVREVLEVRKGKIGISDELIRRYARHLALSHEYVVTRIPTAFQDDGDPKRPQGKGYNPKGLAISPDGRWLYVANRLSDEIGVIDTEEGRVVDVIDLGGPRRMTKVRWGEYLFNHSVISFQDQLSCNTCHPENNVDGLLYDIAIDGGMGMNVIDNRTMRGVAFTAPFKWNGKNPNLARQEGPRAAQLFFRSLGFVGKDREAVVAFIESIPLPPNRYRPLPERPLLASVVASVDDDPPELLTPLQRIGKEIFERAYTKDGRYIPIANRCITCHPPPYYTDRLLHDVGIHAPFDTDFEFDTPQLNNIADTAPYLHDGRCWTLEEIWTVHGLEDLHGVVSDLTKQEFTALIEYLKSL